MKTTATTSQRKDRVLLGSIVPTASCNESMEWSVCVNLLYACVFMCLYLCLCGVYLVCVRACARARVPVYL